MTYRIVSVAEPTRTVVQATGELDAYAAPALKAALAEAAASGANVVCDLRRADFLDSTALGVVVGAFNDAERRGWSDGFAIVLPRGHARRIFSLTGLDGLLPIVE